VFNATEGYDLLLLEGSISNTQCHEDFCCGAECLCFSNDCLNIDLFLIEHMMRSQWLHMFSELHVEMILKSVYVIELDH
jgi:hypothetical protein